MRLASSPQAASAQGSRPAADPLVFPRDKSVTPHAPAAPLDLHEGICDPLAGRCQRWPESLRLLNGSTGQLVAGRCRATNLCRYCQRLYVVETVEMLTLDAVEWAPTLWLVLTAREHLTRSDTYDHLRQLRVAARRRWPGIEWFVQVEFQRRGALHLNLIVKGVPVADRRELHELLVARWCARVDALPAGQWSGAIADAEGVVRYLSKMLAHGLKAEQAPPIGWRGHRTSQTRGYLVRPASVMRQEARRSLRVKRAIWRGMTAEAAELEVTYQAGVEWRLKAVSPAARLRVNGDLSGEAARRERDALLVAADAPVHADNVTRISQDWSSANRAARLRSRRREADADLSDEDAAFAAWAAEQASRRAAPDRPSAPGAVRAPARGTGRRVGGVP